MYDSHRCTIQTRFTFHVRFTHVYLYHALTDVRDTCTAACLPVVSERFARYPTHTIYHTTMHYTTIYLTTVYCTTIYHTMRTTPETPHASQVCLRVLRYHTHTTYLTPVSCGKLLFTTLLFYHTTIYHTTPCVRSHLKRRMLRRWSRSGSSWQT